jgi:transcriptional regulator PpsR
VTTLPVTSFKSPKKWFGGLDADSAGRLIAAAADVALVVDRKGIIRDVAFGNDDLAQLVDGSWIGQAWSDTVTVESRSKIDAMLRDAQSAARTRWRQVNHVAGPAGLPVVYNAVEVGEDGRVVAVGRDLRGASVLQQRLIEAEQAIERDYHRLRHAETRYRLLFQVSSEAVLVLDAASQRIVEANPASAELLALPVRRLIGRPFPENLGDESARAVQGLLAAARTSGAADEVRIQSAELERDFLVSASLFRQEENTYFLVRLRPVGADAGATVVPKARSRALDVIERMPDSLVLTDMQGRVLSANRAFLDLAQMATEEQVRGESLDRWLGRPGVDLDVLVANLRQHSSVRLFATTLRGEYGTAVDVEISGVAVPQGDTPCLGFLIRNIGRRAPTTGSRAGRELPRSVEQLTELVGRVSLKELVRETTDVIEKLCIEAALELTHNNRVSAAEMLGLSRQSLYVKLRRFGLVDAGPEREDAG